MLGVLALLLSACSGTAGSSEADEAPPGTLELGSRSSLDGVRYELEARFVISGPGTTSLEARPGTATLSLELAPGAYTVEIEPGYRVYQDQAVVLTAIEAELLSDAAQSFGIAADTTTRVEYRFTIAAGTLVFGGDELE